ncbi:MAG: hypothetical protein RL093_417, partial [Pseudomonadota bacterium]
MDFRAVVGMSLRTPAQLLVSNGATIVTASDVAFRPHAKPSTDSANS